MDLFKHAFLLSPCCPVSLREDYSCQVEFWHVNLLIITVSGKEGLNTQLNIMLEMVKYDLDVPLYAWVETPTDCCACCLWLMCVACTTRTLARAHTCLITYKQAHYKWQHMCLRELTNNFRNNFIERETGNWKGVNMCTICVHSELTLLQNVKSLIICSPSKQACRHESNVELCYWEESQGEPLQITIGVRKTPVRRM